MFMCLQCFRHALKVNQLAYIDGVQSRLTTWAVSSRDAKLREEFDRKLKLPGVSRRTPPGVEPAAYFDSRSWEAFLFGRQR